MTVAATASRRVSGVFIALVYGLVPYKLAAIEARAVNPDRPHRCLGRTVSGGHGASLVEAGGVELQFEAGARYMERRLRCPNGTYRQGDQ